MGATHSYARRKRSALFGAAALAAGMLGAVDAMPASGSIGPAGLRPGKTITVIHNIDLVAVGGYRPLGREITVRVVRDGVTIGSATGPSTFLPGTVGLEVNHGVDVGTPRPGDCWDRHTPDIRPGDHIVVTDGSGRDEVVVDDIRFTGRPVQEAGTGNVLVPFTAVDAGGTAIPVGRLNAVSFRDDQLRYEADVIDIVPVTDGAPGEYLMRYASPFPPSRGDDEPDPEDPPLTQEGIARSLLGDGHTVGFEPVVDGSGESMLVEGVTDVPGPAVGCEATAPVVPSGVTEVTPRVVNKGNASDPLLVKGFSTDASTVDVELRDADSVVTVQANLSAPSGQQTWRVSVPATELTDLSDNVRVTAVVDGTRSTIAQTAVKDTVAPDLPTVSLPAGTYRGPQAVTIDAAATDRVRYTLGDGRQPAPTAGQGRLYSGGTVGIGSTQTLKVVAVDEPGNTSSVVSRRYRILKAPTSPPVGRATSGEPGGRSTARASWRAPASDNGGRVRAYRVTALRLRADNSVASRRAFKVNRPAARALRMRLAEGRYAFRVQAVNRFGVSPMSARSNPVQSR